MNSTAPSRAVRRVLVRADESADWEIAGLRQLDRIALTVNEFVRSTGEPISLGVTWNAQVLSANRWLPNDSRLCDLTISTDDDADGEPPDLILHTRLFLYRNSIAELLAVLPSGAEPDAPLLEDRSANGAIRRWRWLHNAGDIPLCEREFLRNAGKTQDGIASRYVNRPISNTVTRFLIKLPITPNAWSVSIFALPLCACVLLLLGTHTAFVLGCLIYQLYSILDGCDGEIARAKFLQTTFGRRLDSFLDLVGNILLALCLGGGLARQWSRAHANGWLYVAEGLLAATCIALSEGIVFARRSRGVPTSSPSAKWNAALYQRHHEFLERSGFLVIGENLAWWLIQFTKRDMAMLAFLFLAAAGLAPVILHLLLVVSGISAALAGNAFLRQPASALPQQAS